MGRNTESGPDTVTKPDGTPRRVGVEFELQGIPVDELARLTALTFGGDVERVSKAEYLIDVDDQGQYRVEIDYALLKKLAKAQQGSTDSDGPSIDSLAVDTLSAAVAFLFMGAVTWFFWRLLLDKHHLEGRSLKDRRAVYAFGLHLNAEPPDLDAATIAAYMKAFVCLFDWIVWQGEVDWSRRITPYIKRYSAEYELELTDPQYWPNQDTLIADYLRAEGTRNRALDMLPMFSARPTSAAPSA